MVGLLSADRVSRGRRVQEIQALCGYEDDNIGFAKRLNEAAGELGLHSNWHPTRLSKVRNGTQDLPIEDMAVIAYLDPKQRGWTYVSFGLPLKKGEDAWDALAKTAKGASRRASPA